MDEIKINDDPYKSSRILHIIQAAVEYFIAILVGGTFLAKLTTSIGISDGTTGVLSAFVSLGCSFQIFALFIAHKRPVKRFVVFMNLITQLAFVFLYAVPIIDISTKAKALIFIILLLIGQIIPNFTNACKTVWHMNLVPDKQRGRFSATKEIISLLGGMIFTFIMGNIIDTYEAKGELRTAFILIGITVLVLTLTNALLLILIKEKPEKVERSSIGKQLKLAISDKNLMRLIPLFVIQSMATYSTTPFYGTYQLKELGFTMTFVAVLSFLYSIVRASISRPLGAFADKRSFVTMLNFCYCALTLAYFINIFTVPSNGKIFYTAYYLLNAVSMAGINSGTVNLIYDYVPASKRTSAIALNSAAVGLTGFFTTLLMKPLVDSIQQASNKFLFIENVYAQQVLSFFGFTLTVIGLIYLNVVVKRLDRPGDALKQQKDEDSED